MKEINKLVKETKEEVEEEVEEIIPRRHETKAQDLVLWGLMSAFNFS